MGKTSIVKVNSTPTHSGPQSCPKLSICIDPNDPPYHNVGGCGSCKRLTRLLLQLTTSFERGPCTPSLERTRDEDISFEIAQQCHNLALWGNKPTFLLILRDGESPLVTFLLWRFLAENILMVSQYFQTMTISQQMTEFSQRFVDNTFPVEHSPTVAKQVR